ncbi:MAG: hypothetical protein INR73_03420 [Williamsia sp.]|nr:hypothetical protein [Williamsia sp.]
MAKGLTIKKDLQLSHAEDYEFLRKEGIRLIEQLSGKVWTDYNTHDPGITLLEAVCYTLTDLGYRTQFEIKDLLAPEKGRGDSWEQIFFTARQLLPCNPVTLNDYRKLIIDTPGVRNAWIEPSDEYEIPLYLSQSREAEPAWALTYDAAKGDEVLHLRGLYKVVAEYEDAVLDLKQEETIARNIRKKLSRYRNLCEDFLSVTSVEYEYFRIEAEIQVSEGTDIEKINARIYKVIHDFFSPPILFYSLDQMVEKGYSAEEIFEGPALQHGFIDDRELENSEQYKDIHLSDIMQLISGIEGVIAVKKLAIPAESRMPGADFSQWIIDLKDKQKAPRLDLDNSVVLFVRSGDRHRASNPAQRSPDKGRVKAIFSFLQSADVRSKIKGSAVKDFPVPAGEFMEAADYYPLQSTLPSAYGMTETYLDGPLNDELINKSVWELQSKKDSGKELSVHTTALQDFVSRMYDQSLGDLDEEAKTRLKEDYKRAQLQRLGKREKQTLQLRGFLMVFEQILSDYLAQLAHVRELLSFNSSVKNTYFSQPLQGINDLSALFIDHSKYLHAVSKGNETGEEYIQRRDGFLDHLLARFSESMDKYSYYLQTLEGKEAGPKLISNKIAFLSDYVEISNYRGRGADYNDGEKTWDTTNVEGLKKRICRLLGLPDYSRKTIAPEAIFTENVTVDNSVVQYLTVLKDPAHLDTVLLRSVGFEFEGEAVDTLNYILENGTNRALYEVEGRKDKWTYLLKRASQEGDEEAIASGPNFKTAEEAAAGFEKTLATLELFSGNENFHLVEHILLRPKIAARGKTAKKTGVLDADTVNLLPAEDVADIMADNHKKQFQKPAYRFKITNYKEQAKREKLVWHLGLLDKDEEETLVVEEDFLFYKHLTRRINQIKQFASDHSNYAISRNADGYSIYTINNGGRILATGKRRFRLPEDLENEIAALIRFFSFEAGRQTEETENFDGISYYADPYSLRVSIFIPSWPKKFQNPTFKHLFEKSIYLETPSHIFSQVYWLDHGQMLEFEQAYKVWIEETATSELPNTEIVNNFIDVFNKSRK